jgi:hypothetical protein
MVISGWCGRSAVRRPTIVLQFTCASGLPGRSAIKNPSFWVAFSRDMRAKLVDSRHGSTSRRAYADKTLDRTSLQSFSTDAHRNGSYSG